MKGWIVEKREFVFGGEEGALVVAGEEGELMVGWYEIGWWKEGELVVGGQEDES